ncbi:MAG: CehA/McbA family metallohydrolase, partial [Planctomycetia bacterium]
DDEWFGQAYGVVPVGRQVSAEPAADGKRSAKDPVRYFADGRASVDIPAGAAVELVRRVFPAVNLPRVRGVAERLAGRPVTNVTLGVSDSAGPVPRALCEWFVGDRRHGGGWTGPDGRLAVPLAAADGWRVKVSSQGRGSVERTLAAVTGPTDVVVELPLPGLVVATVSDAAGQPIPCKVQFRRRGPGDPPQADPDFGPESGDSSVKNLVYSHEGRFRRELPPGDYEAIVSLGPEYDAVTVPLAVERGREMPLVATLTRVVDTTGWISGDFHSHSSPSGDNTTSQLGRVQNLLCEHVEFAPCTEHNRVSTYAPHLERLGAARRMATCSGIELTGSALRVNHQNAFPIVERPRAQDGGGPTVDNDNPVAQVERLALWDDGAEKLVQMNHPDLVQILGDRDTDGKPDGGFEGMFGFVDVIEVHPLHEIFKVPAPRDDPRKQTSPIFVWMQMLNLGYRVPGVVNTDAHYAFHGSGWLRNWIESPTDDPAAVAVVDVVRACERGNIVMTSGPFLEANVTASRNGTPARAGPGDSVADDDGAVTLAVRVQCPNWFDVDRVQVFVNGRPDPALDFTRRDQPERFARGVARFTAEVPVRLDRDAHLIVATIGEGSSLGVVMGPEHAADKPVAVTNPIFVDVGGDGFTPSGDLLGLPIPHQPKPTHRRHVHPHVH